MKFKETTKYLDTLWESIFNPKLSMGSDFKSSYANINERVEALANLDYSKLLGESLESSIKTYLDGAVLERNPQVLKQSDWRTIFEHDWAEVKKNYEPLLTNFKKGAIKLEESGTWTKQESIHYRTSLSMFIEILEVKYHEFRTLHKDLIRPLKPVKYPGLAEKLKPWISGADDWVLGEIITNKKLPDGAEKPKWEAGQADAFRMMDWLGMTYPAEFKACFSIRRLHKNNKPEEGATPAKGSIAYTLKTIQL